MNNAYHVECHEPSGNCHGILRCLESGHPDCFLISIIFSHKYIVITLPWWSYVSTAHLSFVLSVSRITRERVNGFQPNVVGIER